MYYDIAVLRVGTSTLTDVSEYVRAVDVASSYSVGETAIAIGNPEGDGTSVTKGIVSVDSEYISMTAADDSTTVTFRVLRIDSAVNGGNSGGGLFNDNGELIGIVNAKLVYTSDGTPIDNIAYALPHNNVTNVADNIIYNYQQNSSAVGVKKLILGISYTTTNNSYTYNSSTGTITLYDELLITSITSGSYAASHTELTSGTIIKGITINGTTTTFERAYELDNLLLTVRAGDSLQLIVENNSVQSTVCFGTITSGMLSSY